MEIDVIENSIKDSKINFIINPTFWDDIDPTVKKLVNAEWKEIKFYNANKKPNDQLNHLPSNKGGIYIFIIKPNIIPDTHMYIMYIGRALITENENLKKRCKHYYNDERPKVKRMIDHWWKYVYIRYLPLDDNDIIKKTEEELINKIIPPCNDRIPNKEVMSAVKAFSM